MNSNTVKVINKRSNAIDITTEATTNDQPAYLIDRRLLDKLLHSFTTGSLDNLKDELHSIVQDANNKDDMFISLDEYIYINGIATKIKELDDNKLQAGEVALDDEDCRVGKMPS